MGLPHASAADESLGPRPSRSPARAWQYLLLAALFAVAATYHLRATWEITRGRLAPDIARGPLWVPSLSNEVSRVQPEAASAGVAPGDRILAVEGRPYTAHVLGREVARRSPGETLRLEVAPEGGLPRQAPVRLASRAEDPPDSAALAIVLGVITPLFCVLLGFAVAVLRPWDPLAWLVLCLLLGFANFIDFVPTHVAWGNLIRVPTIVYREIFGSTWPMSLLLLGVYFPTRLPLDRRHPWLKWLLLVPVGAHAIVAALAAVATSDLPALWPVMRPIVAPFKPNVLNLLFVLAVSTGFSTLGYKAGTVKNPDVSRRLRLLIWGGQVGLTPIGVMAIAGLLTGKNPFEVAPEWLTLLILLLIPIFPGMLAYVVVVHRALDLRNTIRQGLQYALARGGIVALQVAGSVLVVWSAAGLLEAGGLNRPSRIAVIAGGVAFVFLSRAIAQRLVAFTDRRFFREAYDAERVLAELSDEVRTIPDPEALVGIVSRRVSATLHVPRLAVLVRQNDHLVPSNEVGYGVPPRVRLAADGPVAGHVVRSRGGAFVYPEDPSSWMWREGIPAEEREVLRRLSAQLLLPMNAKDRLVGIVALGPKLSEEAYSPTDVRLLSTVASQTALALDNARLAQAVAEEAAQRARMAREIEIAREVQESLYPHERPEIPGLDYAGRCRPARGVGGDYFDFRRLQGGALGLAVGDVSGKGVPAALLMASLQASIRSLELSGADDLAALMVTVDRLIQRASPSNRFATLVYGRYEPGSRRFRYVNAGHNPPMLFRAGGELERLETGGAVLGLLPGAVFGEGVVELGAGDVLVLYSDGITESMNRDDDEWGEERLAETVREAQGLSTADELLDRIFAAAEAFAAGTEQHDDMTLVVVRVVS